MIYSTKINLVVTFFLGALSTFSLAPFNFFFINFFIYSFFFILLHNLNKRKFTYFSFFIFGWSFGFGYFLSSLYWISISLTYDKNFSYLLPFAIILIPAFLAIFYGIAIVLFKLLSTKNNFSSILIFSLCLGTLEYIRGNMLSGFPWNLIGYSFVNVLEFIQINSIIGMYGFNLLSITLFILPSIFFIKKTKREYYPIFGLVFLIILIFIHGNYAIKKFENIEANKSDYNFVIISSDISLERFYSSLDNDEEILMELINLSNPKKFKNKKTIFIWPEGILPKTIANNLSKYKKIIEHYFENDHKVILGLNREQIIDERKHIYNSLVLINNSAEVLSFYDKIRLVPFGEFLPMENILSKVGLKSLTNNYQSYSSGKKAKTNIKIDENLNFLPLICYEIIYPGIIKNYHDYDLIINLSEDGWFGKSLGPHQHFTHSVFRSIETGKYIIRSANNGISSITNPNGKIISKINLQNTGNIVLENYKNSQKTIFSQYGNKVFLILIFIYIFLIFSFNRIKYE